jgi:ribosomal protein S14
MIFSKYKDLKRRKNFLKNEYKSKAIKYAFIKVASNIKKLKKKKRFLLEALYLKGKTKINANKTKIVRRCLLNNRTRNIYRPLNLSRSVLRNLIQFGLVPGFKKAVW